MSPLLTICGRQAMCVCAPKLLLSSDLPPMSRSASPAPAARHGPCPPRQRAAAQTSPADGEHLSNIDAVHVAIGPQQDRRSIVDGRHVVGGRFDDDMIRRHVAEHGAGSWFLLGDNKKERGECIVVDLLRGCTDPCVRQPWFDGGSSLVIRAAAVSDRWFRILDPAANAHKHQKALQQQVTDPPLPCHDAQSHDCMLACCTSQPSLHQPSPSVSAHPPHCACTCCAASTTTMSHLVQPSDVVKREPQVRGDTWMVTVPHIRCDVEYGCKDV